MTDKEAYEARIEAVARAIHEHGEHPDDEPRFQKRRWEDLPNIQRERLRFMARAADAATIRMIELPTQAMEVAAAEQLTQVGAYKAMIAAIPRADK